MTDTIECVHDEALAALDGDQWIVATSFDRPVVVIAGAGSGKTRAVTHRIAHAVHSGIYTPARTLAVTFTTRAASDLKVRLAKLGVPGVAARTIHAAALRQCQFFWPKVYHTDFPPVVENSFALVARAANQVLARAETSVVRDLLTELSWAKSSNIAPDQYADLGAHRQVISTTPAQVAAVLASYEKLKSAAGVVDFCDIVLCAAHLMSNYPEVAATIRDGYRHFVVDEYQDISALSHRLIELWVDDRDDFCVVGDPRQTIHSYAGADASHLKQLAQRDNVTVVALERNYRSTPEICAFGNAVMRQDHGLRATRTHGSQPEVFEANSDVEEAQEIARRFTDAHAAGIPWREMAVLYRINSQSAQVETALTQAGIPYTVRDSKPFYERPEIQRALKIIAHSAKSSLTDVSIFLAEVMQASGWVPDPPSSTGAQRAAWESLEALRRMLLAETFSSPQEVAAWLDQRSQWEASPDAEAVTLASMHASKGLEWALVAVIGVRESLVPFSLSVTEEAVEEERRLLYVAVTRAKDRLIVTWPKNASGHSSPSRFIRPYLAGLNNKSGFVNKRVSRGPRPGTCSICGGPVIDGRERKLRRHVDCEPKIDLALFEVLKQWRKAEAERAKVPAFVVFTDATLQAIAEAHPRTETELLKIPGVGRIKMQRYGQACLEVVEDAEKQQKP